MSCLTELIDRDDDRTKEDTKSTFYLQTARGELNEIHGILSRIRESALQSASDDLNTNDRARTKLQYLPVQKNA